MTSRDIAWLSGLLEGEGWFGISPKGGPIVQLVMKDGDVVERAARLLRVKVHPLDRKDRAYPMYRFTAAGRTAAGTMMTILPFLGRRRRARVEAVLERWRIQSVHNAYRKFCKHGHLLSGDNVRHLIDRGSRRRRCLTCYRATMARFTERRRAKHLAA